MNGELHVNLFWFKCLLDCFAIGVCDLAERCRGVDEDAGGAVDNRSAQVAAHLVAGHFREAIAGFFNSQSIAPYGRRMTVGGRKTHC